MSHIILGKSGKRNLTLDLDVLLRTRLLVQANSGGGKSWLLRRLAEQLFGKIPVIIIDPEGEFATLREKFGYVLVGKGGETPTDPRSASLVAHKLLELRASAVCDLYELKPAERHRWVRLFLESLIDAPKKLWRPTVIIVDEAHTFCPEKGAGESEASDAMTSLPTRGRKRRFCAIWATQRLGKLRKDASAELLNRLIGPTFEDVDLKRAADLLSIRSEDRHAFDAQMRVLEPGNFFALGRAITKERLLVKIGAVETSHEIEDARYGIEAPPPPEKVKLLLPKLADLPKAAEEQARTEAQLRAEIRSLKGQIRLEGRQAAAAPADHLHKQLAQKAAIEASERAVAGESMRLRALLEDAMKVVVSIKAIGLDGAALKPEQVTAGLDLASKQIVKAAEACIRDRQRKFDRLKMQADSILVRLKEALSRERLTVKVDFKPAQPEAPKEVEPASDRPLPSSERRILAAIAQYPEGVDRGQLSILTGYKRSTRDAYVARLRAKSLVEERGGKLVASELGIAALGGAYEPLPEGEELQQYWLGRLPRGEKKIFELLLAAAGAAISRDELTEGTGFQRSTRDAYIARMVAKKIIEPVGRGEVKAADLLFA
jgi:hypothetical protein